jgi:hypothetical protein
VWLFYDALNISDFIASVLACFAERCLLSFGAEFLVFQFANQNIKNAQNYSQRVVLLGLSLCGGWSGLRVFGRKIIGANRTR